MLRVTGLLCVLSVVATQTTSSLQRCTCFKGVIDCSNRSKSELHQEDFCSNASKIDLSQNAFIAYPNNLQPFRIVNMKSNLFTRLPCASKLNSEIDVLNLAHNSICNTSHELRTLSTLRKLLINGNKIESLDFIPFSCNLEFFDTSQNYISTLSNVLKRCKHLKKFNLQNNLITNIPEGILSEMSRLLVLNLDGNPLEVIETGAFRDHPALQKLYMRNCRLRSLPAEVFTGVYSLWFLALTNNSISSLPVLRNCCLSSLEADFRLNSISELREESVRSFLRIPDSALLLHGNTIRVSSLQWVKRSRDLLSSVDSHVCECGDLRGRRSAAVFFCTDANCTVHRDWLEATGNDAHTENNL